MKTQNNINQRDFQRKPCPGIMVLYSDQEHFYSDYIYDISESGIFINSNKSLAVGSKITMSFLSFHKKGPIKISGHVIRALPRGIGVQFRKHNDIQLNALNTFVEGFLS